MTSLTDRYVWAAVRSLPEKQRADIEQELRASIADAVEAKIEAGQRAESAEKDTLIDMGDPDRLAASYADRPTYLIGPKYFFDYSRLLKLLLAIVTPSVFGAMILAQLLAENNPGGAIGAAIGTTLAVVVHLCFWVTLLFVILDRAQGKTTRGWTPERLTWSLDYLPELPSGSKIGIVETVLVSALLALFAGSIVWQQFYSVFEDESGNPIPLVNPELWSFWLPFFLAVIALEIVFLLVLYRLGRWTFGLAWANVALNVIFAVPAVWLFLQNLVFNPEFLARLEWLDPVGERFLAPGIVLGVVLIGGWDSIDGFLRARRARSAQL
jgi:hypothetical protein